MKLLLCIIVFCLGSLVFADDIFHEGDVLNVFPQRSPTSLRSSRKLSSDKTFQKFKINGELEVTQGSTFSGDVDASTVKVDVNELSAETSISIDNGGPFIDTSGIHHATGTLNIQSINVDYDNGGIEVGLWGPKINQYGVETNVLRVKDGATNKFVVYPTGNVEIQGKVTVGGTEVISSSGTIDASRIINLPTVDLTNLDATSITSGTIGVSHIPNLSADKISSGTLDNSRLPNAISVTSLSAGTATLSSVDYETILEGVEKFNLRKNTNNKATFITTASLSTDTYTYVYPERVFTQRLVSSGTIHAQSSVNVDGTATFNGDVVFSSGISVTGLNASGITSGTLDTDRLPNDIPASKIVGQISASTIDGDLDLGDNQITAKNATITGDATFQGDVKFDQNIQALSANIGSLSIVTGNINAVGQTTVADLDVTGTLTASDIQMSGNTTMGSQDNHHHTLQGTIRVKDNSAESGGASYGDIEDLYAQLVKLLYLQINCNGTECTLEINSPSSSSTTPAPLTSIP